MKVFVLIFINCIHVLNGIFYDCSDGEVKHVQLNTPTFFKTTNYPMLMEIEDYLNCNLTFVLNSTQTQDVELVVASHCELKDYFFDEDYDVSSGMDSIVWDTFTFEMKTFYIPNIMDGTISIAQNGLAVFENTKNGCPLESFTREKPYTFTENEEIIYLTADYYGKPNKGNMTCLWRFIAPDGYGFKIVLTIQPNYRVLIRNSTDLLANERSVKPLHPIYNSDNYIEIFMKKDEFWDNESMFEGYVSIVEKHKNKTVESCALIKINDLTMKWTSINFSNEMYKKDIECRYTFDISPNTQIHLQINTVDVESLADSIRYYFEDDKSTIFDIQDLNHQISIVLEPYDNGQNKTVTFVFESDGSVQGGGFSIQFETIYCKCLKSILFCNDKTISTTEKRYIQSNNNQCSFLHCNYTIGKCKTPRTYLELDFNNEIAQSDGRFRIISNHVTILDRRSFEYKSFPIFLNTSYDNIVEISGNKDWITLTPFSFEGQSKPLNFLITQLNQNVILDPATFQLAVISLDKNLQHKNLSFEIITTFNDLTYIFLNENLTDAIACFTTTSFQCKIKSYNLAFYNDFLNGYYFIQIKERPQTCLFDNNIYYLEADTIVSAVSAKEEECEVVLILDSDNSYLITHLWTTASVDDPIKMFIGIERKIVFFEFDSISASVWKDVALFSKIYSVRIPKNKSLLMKISQIFVDPNDFSPYERHIHSFPYQSVVSTPFFGVAKTEDDFRDGTFMMYDVGIGISLKFTAIVYDIPTTDTLYFFSYNTSKIYYVTKAGFSMTFGSGTLTLFYSFEDTKKSNGAIFYIEAINSL